MKKLFLLLLISFILTSTVVTYADGNAAQAPIEKVVKKDTAKSKISIKDVDMKFVADSLALELKKLNSTIKDNPEKGSGWIDYLEYIISVLVLLYSIIIKVIPTAKDFDVFNAFSRLTDIIAKLINGKGNASKDGVYKITKVSDIPPTSDTPTK